MTQVRLVEVAVEALVPGMYIAELDRPWMDSPFLIEGFVLEDMEQFELLRSLCSYVVIDTERSDAAAVRQVLDAGAYVPDTGTDDAAAHVARAGAQRLLDAAEPAAQPDTHNADVGAGAARTATAPLLVPLALNFVAGPQLAAAEALQQRCRAVVGRLVADVDAHRDLQLDEAREVVAAMGDSIAANPDALVWLSHLKREDEYLYKHAFDCSVHLMDFGRYLAYPRETLQALGMAGLLLDLGKVRVPAAIRNRTGRLSAREFAEMRRHVTYSVEMLRGIPGVGEKVLETVGQHHERMNGSGYPAGLPGVEISALGCMAAIVDTYTALISQRPHAAAQSIQAALQTLDHWKRRHFNEGLCEQFIECIGVYPVGSLVELNTGEVGVVVRQNPIRRTKPEVLVVLDTQQQACPFPRLMELALDPIAFAQEPCRILRDLPSGSYDLDSTEFYMRSV